jgi:hypothetical protein
MKKWTWFALLAIFILAVLIRLFPLTQYAIWGSDTGEYYYISNYLANEYVIPEDYNGWGFGYPYFPGMYYLTVGVSQLTGLDLLYTMMILIPVLGALSPVLIFLLTRRLGGSCSVGLIAAAFVAVVMPHVLTTSHAMPGTLGDILALTCMLLLLKSYTNRHYLPLLIMSTIALVITHHLSTFILLIAIITITFTREILKVPKTSVERVKLDLAYIGTTITMMLAFWFIYAVPFREKVVARNIGGFELIHLIALIYIGFAVLVALVYLARNYSSFTLKPKINSPLHQFGYFITMIIIVTITMVVSTMVPIPPLELTINPIVILYLLPMILLLLFGIIGLNPSSLSREGMFLIAWAISGVFAAVVMIISGSREIMLYRFTQYIIEPWAISVGFGFMAAFTMFINRQNSKERADEGTLKPVRIWPAVIVLAILIVSSGATAYPPRSALNGFQEGITESEMDGVIWCSGNLESGATVATDHRLSSMLFGFAGINASWDFIERTYREDNFEDIRQELNSSSLPSGRKRIDYVMLSDEMREGVALVQWQPAVPMSPKAEAKFQKSPFYTVYDSGEVQVYLIDWKAAGMM